MRTSIVFVLGLILGAAVTTRSQGNRVPALGGINHVGMALDNFDESVAFYTQKMGFPKVFRARNDKGDTTLVFVQVNRDTFLELAPSNANRPAGLTHFGVGVTDIKAAVAGLKDHGLTVTDPRSVGTQWNIASVTAPGSRIELVELGPESPLAKASAGWK